MRIGVANIGCTFLKIDNGPRVYIIRGARHDIDGSIDSGLGRGCTNVGSTVKLRFFERLVKGGRYCIGQLFILVKSFDCKQFGASKPASATRLGLAGFFALVRPEFPLIMQCRHAVVGCRGECIIQRIVRRVTGNRCIKCLFHHGREGFLQFPDGSPYGCNGRGEIAGIRRLGCLGFLCSCGGLGHARISVKKSTHKKLSGDYFITG